MSSVLVDQSSEEDAFVLPEGLSLPTGMATVCVSMSLSEETGRTVDLLHQIVLSNGNQ